MSFLKKIFSFFIKTFFRRRTNKKNYVCFGTFKDHRNNHHPLLMGLRQDLKPGWQTMLAQNNGLNLPAKEETTQIKNYAVKKTREMAHLLSRISFDLKGKTILEIGCNDGSKSFSLTAFYPRKIIAADVISYYLNERINEKQTAKAKNRQRKFMEKLREETKQTFLNEKKIYQPDRVLFVEDDICNSRLPATSFDLICSWEVLEHLANPDSAFAQIYRLLKPNGFTFHEYNPFFCLAGGHSLCTLDFYWGHTRLDERDFYRYLKEVRPQEIELAKRFYKYNLNRMTLNNLRTLSRKHHLSIIEFITWPSNQDLELVDEEIYSQTKNIYPSLCLGDLITPRVWLVQQKIN